MPKALVRVGDGPQARPLVLHALERGVAAAAVTEVVVVAPAGEDGSALAKMAAAIENHPLPSGVRLQVVAGGAERTDSVAAGLRALSAQVGIVLVHDAARAFTPTGVFDRVVTAVRGGHAAVVPALPVTDTIKTVRTDGEVEVVTGTPERSILRAVQTPQGFLRETLERAHAQGGPAGSGAARHTDDAGLVEAHGGHVAVVPGDARALKVTTPHDLALARGWVAESASPPAPLLVVLSGLPGVGKTTLARALCRRLGATHLRVDSVEQALVRGGMVEAAIGAQGYAVTYAVALDQLLVGRPVVADLVNGIPEAREAWSEVAQRGSARLLRVLLECSDPAVHRRRVEDREADLQGHALPTWDQVEHQTVTAWPEADLVIDTAHRGVDEIVDLVEERCR